MAVEAEVKEKILDALNDPDMAACLEAILGPIVSRAVSAAMEAKDEEIAKLKEEVTECKLKIDELEQYSRKNCLNVTGIPETSEESTNQIIKDLCKVIGVQLDTRDIDTSHRIGKQSGTKPRTIICKFTR